MAIGSRPDRVSDRGWNVPSPLPSSTDTVPPNLVGDGQVEMAIAAEVTLHHCDWV